MTCGSDRPVARHFVEPDLLGPDHDVHLTDDGSTSDWKYPERTSHRLPTSFTWHDHGLADKVRHVEVGRRPVYVSGGAVCTADRL